MLYNVMYNDTKSIDIFCLQDSSVVNMHSYPIPGFKHHVRLYITKSEFVGVFKCIAK